MKLNNNTSAKEMKKQTLEKIVYKIDIYLIENSNTTAIFYIVQTLLSKNVVIQTTSIEKTKKLRK